MGSSNSNTNSINNSNSYSNSNSNSGSGSSCCSSNNESSNSNQRKHPYHYHPTLAMEPAASARKVFAWMAQRSQHEQPPFAYGACLIGRHRYGALSGLAS